MARVSLNRVYRGLGTFVARSQSASFILRCETTSTLVWYQNQSGSETVVVGGHTGEPQTQGKPIVGVGIRVSRGARPARNEWYPYHAKAGYGRQEDRVVNALQEETPDREGPCGLNVFWVHFGPCGRPSWPNVRMKWTPIAGTFLVRDQA
jgi:hypothetical protein